MSGQVRSTNLGMKGRTERERERETEKEGVCVCEILRNMPLRRKLYCDQIPSTTFFKISSWENVEGRVDGQL